MVELITIDSIQKLRKFRAEGSISRIWTIVLYFERIHPIEDQVPGQRALEKHSSEACRLRVELRFSTLAEREDSGLRRRGNFGADSTFEGDSDTEEDSDSQDLFLITSSL